MTGTERPRDRRNWQDNPPPPPPPGDASGKGARSADWQDKSGEPKSERFRGQFFKTVKCSFFANGACRNGSSCNFAHEEAEVQNRPNLTKTSLCRKWENGACSLQAGECLFAHGPHELRSTPTFRMASDTKDWNPAPARGSPSDFGKAVAANAAEASGLSRPLNSGGRWKKPPDATRNGASLGDASGFRQMDATSNQSQQPWPVQSHMSAGSNSYSPEAAGVPAPPYSQPIGPPSGAPPQQYSHLIGTPPSAPSPQYSQPMGTPSSGPSPPYSQPAVGWFEPSRMAPNSGPQESRWDFARQESGGCPPSPAEMSALNFVLEQEKQVQQPAFTHVQQAAFTPAQQPVFTPVQQPCVPRPMVQQGMSPEEPNQFFSTGTSQQGASHRPSEFRLNPSVQEFRPMAESHPTANHGSGYSPCLQPAPQVPPPSYQAQPTAVRDAPWQPATASAVSPNHWQQVTGGDASCRPALAPGRSLMPRETAEDYEDFFEDLPRSMDAMDYHFNSQEVKAFVPAADAQDSGFNCRPQEPNRLPLSRLNAPGVVGPRLNGSPMASMPQDDGSVNSGDGFDHHSMHYPGMPMQPPPHPPPPAPHQALHQGLGGDATPNDGLSMSRTLVHDMLMKAIPDFYED